MSTTLLFQFHNHIAKNILHQDPHATNYWGNKEIGSWLHDLMSPGASVDLKEQNKGREYTLPETPGA
jgi:peptidyl-dipeptidase A